MFESLCFFTPSVWHGISYKGGGLSTTHGAEGCNVAQDYSDKSMVMPATMQDLSLKGPKYYMIGGKHKGEMWA